MLQSYMSPLETIGHKEFAGKFCLRRRPACDAAQPHIEQDNSVPSHPPWRDLPKPLQRDFCISDKSARGILGVRLWQKEIEDAYTEFLLAAIRTSVACADHNRTPVGSRLANVNHGMSHGRVDIHRISANPEQQISRAKSIQFKTVQTIANDRMKGIRLAHPHVLRAGRSWDILYSHRLQQEVDCA
jgi:hypothetical protein